MTCVALFCVALTGVTKKLLMFPLRFVVRNGVVLEANINVHGPNPVKATRKLVLLPLQIAA